MFLSITEQQNLAMLADQVVQREFEVFGYQHNAANYTSMLETYPNVALPEELLQYVGVPVEQIPESVPVEDIMKIFDMVQRNNLITLIRTENIELAKAKRLLEILKSRIPAELLDQLVAEATDRFKARQPQ